MVIGDYFVLWNYQCTWYRHAHRVMAVRCFEAHPFMVLDMYFEKTLFRICNAFSCITTFEILGSMVIFYRKSYWSCFRDA